MKFLYIKLTALLLFFIVFSNQAQTSELWGNTYRMGPLGGGAVIKANDDGTNLQVVKAFSNANTIEGFDVRGVFAASNQKIYGLTERGGDYGAGSLFMIDPDTNQFFKLHDFHPSNEGGNPISGLVEVDGVLYGTLAIGGINGGGAIFRYNIQSNNFEVVHQFINQEGYSPRCTLMKASNGYIYGTTVSGGQNNNGTLFALNPINSQVFPLTHFNQGTGYNSHSDLVEVSGRLFGTTYVGGNYGQGTVFEFNISPIAIGPRFNVRHHFDGFNGARPFGGLVIKPKDNQNEPDRLLGLTFSGGINGMGVVYEFDPNSFGFAKRADFLGGNGIQPVRNLTLSTDGYFYTTTYQGGVYDGGVLARYNYRDGSLVSVMDFNRNTIGRQSNESLTLLERNEVMCDLASVTATTTDATCNNTDDGSAQITINFADQPVAIEANFGGNDWFPAPFGVPPTNPFSFPIDNLEAGTYTIKFRDEGKPECEVSYEFTVGVNQNPVDVDGDGYTACDGDCDDNNSAINPGVPEIYCDGIDNDCNPLTLDESIIPVASGLNWIKSDPSNLIDFGVNGGLERVGPSSWNVGAKSDIVTGDFVLEYEVEIFSAGGVGNGDCIFGYSEDDPDPSNIVVNGRKLLYFDQGYNLYNWGTIWTDAISTNAAIGDVVTFTVTRVGSLITYTLSGQTGADASGIIESSNSNPIYPVVAFYSAGCRLNKATLNGENLSNLSGLTIWYSDNDGDGFGDANDPGTASCYQLPDTSENNLDCNDNNPDINPQGTEVCDNADNNCDGTIDEGFDLDGDGVTTCAGDCDDTDASVYPGAPEINCDGVDNDCNPNTPDNQNPVTTNFEVTNVTYGPVTPLEFGVDFIENVDYTFASAGSNPGEVGGRTWTFTDLMPNNYGGLWFTFNNIENPRHSSQAPTGSMELHSFDASTGVATFYSTAPLTWTNPANGQLESVNTQFRMQVQPVGAGGASPMSAGVVGGIPNTIVDGGEAGVPNLGLDWPTLDISQQGDFQVWFAFEVQGTNQSLTQFYDNASTPPNTSFFTSVYSSFYSATPVCSNPGNELTVTAIPDSNNTAPFVYTFNDITNTTGVFPGIAAGTYNFSVLAANGCLTTGTQTVGVPDLSFLEPIPDLETLPDITAECEVTSLTSPTASTICGGQVNNVSHNASLPITTQGTTLVTWTFDGGNGNVTTQTQNVILEDTTPPSLSCTPMTVDTDEGVCEAYVEVTPPAVSDNCTSTRNGLAFDGIDDFVSIGSLGNARTIEFWMNIDYSFNPSQEFNMLFNFNNSIYNYISIGNITSSVTDETLSIVALNSGGGFGVVSIKEELIGWNHIAIVSNGSSYNSIYVNGNPVTIYASGATSVINIGSGFIGKRGETESRYNGDLDEVRIWNVSRSQAEIQNNYEKELSAQSGLIALYSFNENIAYGNNDGHTSLTDSSGNSNNGTLNNFDLIGSNSNWISGYNGIDIINDRTSASDASGVYPLGETEIIWTVTDTNGNSNTCAQTITVVDNEDPIAIAKNITVELEANGQVIITPQDIDNGSSDNCEIQSSQLDKTIFDCSDIVNGAINNALDFDGVDDYVFAPNIGATSLNSFTVEAWVKTTQSGSYKRITSKPAGGGQNYSLALNNGKPHIRFDKIGGGGQQAEGISSINDGNWHYLAGVHNTNLNSLILYVDGIPVANTATSGDPQTSSENIYMGKFSSLYDGYFQGTVDEVRIWNIPRSASEILSNYNKSLTGNETGLVAYYDFNDGVNSTATDKSSNGNDGVVTNMDPNTDWVSGAPALDNQGVPVILTVTDGNNNQSAATANVTVIDNLPPEVIGQNIEVTLTASGTVSIVANDVLDTGSDNCGPVTYSISQDTFGAQDAIDSPVTIQLTASDPSGNETMVPVIVTVIDPVPNAICQSITVYLDANGTATITPDDIDNGSNSVVGIGSLSLDIDTFGCENIGSNIVKLTVTSTLGATATCDAMVMVIDNLQPVIVCQNMTVQLDEDGNASIGADDVDDGSSDNCGIASVSFITSTLGGEELVTNGSFLNGANGGYAWAKYHINQNAGWQSSGGNPDQYFKLDGDGDTNTDPSIIQTLNNLQIGKTYTITGSYTGFTAPANNEGNVFAIDLGNTELMQLPNPGSNWTSFSATFEATAENHNITFRAEINGSDIAIGLDNISSKQPISYSTVSNIDYDCSNVGDNEVTLLVMDVNGNSSTCNASVTVKDEVVPVPKAQNVIVQLDADGNGSTTAELVDNGSNDACGIKSLVLSKTSFTCAEVGANTVTLTVTDNNDNVSTMDATVDVQDNVNPIALAQNVIVQLDADGNGSTTAELVDNGSNDACGIKSLVLSKTSFTCAEVGANTVTLTVTDNNDNVSTMDATVDVQDNVNPIALAQNVIVQLDADGNGSTTAELVDNGSNDACGIKSLVLSKTSFTCAEVGANTVTLTVTDNNDNVSTMDATVDVQDNVNPIALAQNVIVQLDADGNGSTTAELVDNGSNDACGIKSLVLSKTSFTCAEVGANTVTLTVTDNNDNVSTMDATVDVQDNVNPIALAQNVIVQLDADGNGSTTAELVDNGSNDACGIKSLVLSKTSFTCAEVGANTVTLTVTDNNDNVSTIDATVDVQDNVNPIALAQNVIVQLDADGNGSTTAELVDNGSNDACGIKSLVLSKTSFTCAEVGANTVTLTVTDNNDNVSTIDATVDVQDNVNPIALAQNVIVQLDADGNGSTTAELIDNGSNDACGIKSLVLSKTSFTCAEVGANTVTLTVTDNNDNVSTMDATVDVQDNVNPIALAQNVIVQLDADGNGSTTAELIDNGSNDACGIKSLVLSKTSFTCAEVGANTVTLTVTDNNDNVSTMDATVDVQDNVNPIALAQNVIVQLDADGNGSTTAELVDNGSNDACGIKSLVLSKTSFTCAEVGANTVTLTVTDNNDNVSTMDATVDVQDNVNPIALAQNVIVQLDADGNGSTTAELIDNGSNDACGIKSLVLSKTSFTCAEVGANTVTLTVTDNNDNVSTMDATVDVQDNVNPIALAQNVIVQLDADGNGSTTAELVDNGSNDACGIKSLVLSKTSFTCAEVGANTVTLTVTDNNDNVSTMDATVDVQDNVNPIALAQNVIVQLDADGNGSTTAELVDNGSNDACGIKSLVLSKTSFTCAEVGANTVTLTVTDNNDNVSTMDATVDVQDNVNPIALAQNVIVQLDADGNGSTTAELVDNGSNDACGIKSLVLSKTSFTCAEVGANTVTLTVTDNNDNVSTMDATVDVQDNVNPIALAQNVIVQLDADGNGSTTAELIDNGSNDACGIKSLVLSKTSFTCAEVGANTVTLTVTDNNDNVSTMDATVDVQDNVNPIITCVNDSSRYIDPYQTYYTVDGTEFDATATDACGIASLTYVGGIVSTNGTTMDGVQLNLGVNTMDWTAFDFNGNESDCATVITVIKRPTTITYNGDIDEQYSDSVNLSATLSDNVSGNGVQGKTVKFTIGSQSTTAVTNGSGVASTTLILTQDPYGTYSVKAEFLEDASYLGSHNQVGFDITQEDAIVVYTGQSLQATPSSSSSEATIILSANIQDISVNLNNTLHDPYAGDIRNARVKFVHREGTFDSGWLNVNDLVDPSDNRTGSVSFNWPVDIGQATSESYTIGIIVDTGYYIRDSSEDDTVVTVYVPTGDFITGGGYIVPNASAGQFASTNGLKTNFGFNVKYNKKGNKLKGHMNVIFRRLENDGIVHVYQIKSNAVQSLGVDISDEDAQFATFITKSNLKDITDPLNTISLGGNLILKVDMTDRGEPGEFDSIAFNLTEGNTGALLYSSNWTGVNTSEMQLTGGNLKVHSGFSLGTTAQKTLDVPEDIIITSIELKSWPNPSDSYFNIKLQSNNNLDMVNITVFDVTNKLVHKGEFNPNDAYRFGARLEGGVYIIKIEQAGKIESVRLVKY